VQLRIRPSGVGTARLGFAEAFTGEEVAKQLDVNVVGVHRVTRAFLPSMRARAGLIINMSSTAGRVAAPFNGLCHAGKWALEGYSLAHRRKLASSGIDVMVVEPGSFTTALFPTMRQRPD
jgi:NAD(P)-dependent dehydrogenase (short-subunit alcohol dehydrogenase family)